MHWIFFLKHFVLKKISDLRLSFSKLNYLEDSVPNISHLSYFSFEKFTKINRLFDLVLYRPYFSGLKLNLYALEDELLNVFNLLLRNIYYWLGEEGEARGAGGWNHLWRGE